MILAPHWQPFFVTSIKKTGERSKRREQANAGLFLLTLGFGLNNQVFLGFGLNKPTLFFLRENVGDRKTNFS